MGWIYFAVAAQFLNALVAFLDKRIVSDEKMLPQPFVYAFYTCLISGAWVAVYLASLLPLPLEGIHIPSFDAVTAPTLSIALLAIAGAATFFMGLLFMFTAFRKADASDVVPVVGASSAIASLVFAYLFLDAPFVPHFFAGATILAIGTFLVSRFHFNPRTAVMAIYSGAFFALHYITVKKLFLVTSFDNGFFWSRIAFMLFAVALLAVPAYARNITAQTRSTTPQAGILILITKLFAGVATILVLKATDQGDVAVVQALGGLQYIFLFILGLSCTFLPYKNGYCEIYNRDSILRKAIFVSVIALGFLVLFQ